MIDLASILAPYAVTGPPAPMPPWSTFRRRLGLCSLAEVLAPYTVQRHTLAA